jgi:drug/metabolite transporter (DMT)-like permease
MVGWNDLLYSSFDVVALGEVCNFMAYAFSPAFIVTPLGAISVVISAILSVYFLKEKMNFSGGCGVTLCIIGSIIMVLHSPQSTQTDTLPSFISYVIAPGFLIYSGVFFLAFFYLLFSLAPKYGSKNPLIYIFMTSICGAFLVNACQG